VLVKSAVTNKLLPLWDGAVECCHCGHCCRQTSCGFGTWDPVAKQCADLVEKPDGTFDCGKFDEIVNGTDRTWRIAPAFGAGCCSGWNEDRRKIMGLKSLL